MRRSRSRCADFSVPLVSIIPRLLLTFALIALIPATAQAHALLHEIVGDEVVVVRFQFAGTDEQPWFEPYEIFAPGSATPHQRGLVNANGEITFRPSTPGRWQVRVATEDGHGANVSVDVSEAGRVEAGGSTPFGQRLAMAMAILFGVFGVAALARDWRRRPGVAGKA